jgi:hypothetical protein
VAVGAQEWALEMGVPEKPRGRTGRWFSPWGSHVFLQDLPSLSRISGHKSPGSHCLKMSSQGQVSPWCTLKDTLRRWGGTGPWLQCLLLPMAVLGTPVTVALLCSWWQ